MYQNITRNSKRAPVLSLGMFRFDMVTETIEIWSGMSSKVIISPIRTAATRFDMVLRVLEVSIGYPQLSNTIQLISLWCTAGCPVSWKMLQPKFRLNAMSL